MPKSRKIFKTTVFLTISNTDNSKKVELRNRFEVGRSGSGSVHRFNKTRSVYSTEVVGITWNHSQLKPTKPKLFSLDTSCLQKFSSNSLTLFMAVTFTVVIKTSLIRIDAILSTYVQCDPLIVFDIKLLLFIALFRTETRAEVSCKWRGKTLTTKTTRSRRGQIKNFKWPVVKYR